jgi:hypothetical protein
MGSSSLSAPAKAPAHSPSTRGSSPRSPPCRRPKLMRSSATAPSVVISTASRNDLSSYNPMSMASTLLSRVASYSGPRQDQHSGLCPPSNRHKSASPRRRSPHSREASRRRGTGDIHRDDQLRGQLLLFNICRRKLI